MNDMSDQFDYLAEGVARIRAWAFSDEARQTAQGLTTVPELVDAAIKELAQAADHPDNEALRSQGISALFRDLVEYCNDRLDGEGRDAYAAFFPAIIWHVVDCHSDLRQRFAHFGIRSQADCYRRYHARRLRGQTGAVNLPDIVEQVVVLSRVTIGADVLLTSILCQRIHEAFPAATITVLGDKKLQGLLGGLPQVRILPLSYTRRGALNSRLSSWLTLSDMVDKLEPDLVISPDSRLDQLGIMPLVEDDMSYLLWENTQIDPPHPVSLGRLLDQWAVRVFALQTADYCPPHCAFDTYYAQQATAWRNLLAPLSQQRPLLAVKFDHGGNPDKSLPQATEIALMQCALEQGWRIILDAGFGAEELANSFHLAEQCSGAQITCREQDGLPSDAQMDTGWDIVRFEGSIAGWAAILSACQAAISYDSVGHHLAGALKIPLLSLFTGHQADSFPVAWAPQGSGQITQVVIPSAEREQSDWHDRCLTSLKTFLHSDHLTR